MPVRVFNRGSGQAEWPSATVAANPAHYPDYAVCAHPSFRASRSVGAIYARRPWLVLKRLAVLLFSNSASLICHLWVRMGDARWTEIAVNGRFSVWVH